MQNNVKRALINQWSVLINGNKQYSFISAPYNIILKLNAARKEPWDDSQKKNLIIL